MQSSKDVLFCSLEKYHGEEEEEEDGWKKKVDRMRVQVERTS